MKRDMDILREILLNLENNPKIGRTTLLSGRVDDILGYEEADAEREKELAHGLILLLDEELVKGEYIRSSSRFKIEGITNKGHDFLDAIRDPEIWKHTKDAGLKVGGWTLEILRSIAVGYLKQKALEITGISI